MHFIVIVTFIALANAQSGRYHQPAPGQPIAILRQSQDINVDGSYQYAYETENGIAAQEQGALKNANSPEPVLAAQGSFQFTAPDGTPIAVQYTADENGFLAQGAHLPVAPPIPDAIQKSIAYNLAHPEQDDGQNRPGRIGYRN